jgi:hypothetical protein
MLARLCVVLMCKGASPLRILRKGNIDVYFTLKIFTLKKLNLLICTQFFSGVNTNRYQSKYMMLKPM